MPARAEPASPARAPPQPRPPGHWRRSPLPTAGASGGWQAQQRRSCVLLLGGIYARHVWVARHAARPVSESKVLKAFGAGNPGVKVWVNTDSGTYHCPGTRWYGKTQEGEYMTQKQAQDKGYHPAANRACM